MKIIEGICTILLGIYIRLQDWLDKHRNQSNENNQNAPDTDEDKQNVPDTEANDTNSNTKKNERHTVDYFMYFFDRLGSGIVRCATIGIILNIVVAYFYPELPERIPIIFGWYDGCMQLAEFSMKSALGMINAFFHGEAIGFYGEVREQLQVMWAQFVNWLSAIHF